MPDKVKQECECLLYVNKCLVGRKAGTGMREGKGLKRQLTRDRLF